MERQVFVSHAADDPDWPPEAIEAVASAICDAGVAVRLDLWHQQAVKRHLSLSEWRGWMDDAIRDASHILCLVSPRYQQLWQRRPEDPGGFGVAFESIRMIHGLYLSKQRSHGHLLTLRPEGHGYGCIPFDLSLDCAAYVWAGDRAMLLSHVSEADLPAAVIATRPLPATPNPPVPSSPAVPAPAPHRATGLSWASASGQDEYGHWADLTIEGATQRMRWIPPTGPESFWMGSTAAERAAIQDNDVRDWANKTEHAPRREQVATGFWLADTPCTQAFWRAVADVDPSHFSTGADAPLRPVDSVSWDTVMDQFIARLAARPGWDEGDVVCLPSELEWEYAARAGTRTAYGWGDTWDDSKANAGNRIGSTTPVNRYPPNRWGLYDMHGNVWEWCEDPWRDRRDAPGARPDDVFRVARGGSWISLPGFARAAYRNGGGALGRGPVPGIPFRPEVSQRAGGPVRRAGRVVWPVLMPIDRVMQIPRRVMVSPERSMHRA